MCVCCPVGRRNDKIKGKGIRHTKKICVALGYTSITGHNKQHEIGTTNQIRCSYENDQSNQRFRAKVAKRKWGWRRATALALALAQALARHVYIGLFWSICHAAMEDVINQESYSCMLHFFQYFNYWLLPHNCCGMCCIFLPHHASVRTRLKCGYV